MNPPKNPETIEARLDRLGATVAAGPSVVDAVMRRIEADEARAGAGGVLRLRRPWIVAAVRGAAALAACVALFVGLYFGRPRHNAVVISTDPGAAPQTRPLTQPQARPGVSSDINSFFMTTRPASAPAAKEFADGRFSMMFDPFPDHEEVLLKGSRWGFINAAGKVVIEPQFDRAGRFSEGRAAVRVNGRWGYIGPDGKVVIEPVYQAAQEFYEGLAAVQGPKAWAYIDTKGMPVAGPGFESAGPFKGGMALVKLGGRYGFINAAGAAAIPPQFQWAGHFSEGVAPVRLEQGQPVSFVDATGKVVMSPEADFALPFSQGRAGAMVKDRWGLIDHAGQWVVPPQYDQLCWSDGFNNGLCRVKLNKKYGYIDRTGVVVIPVKYWEAWPFAEGLAHVEEKNDETGDWGYIDTTGRLVFAQKRASTQCSNGLIRMQVSEGYVFLDRTGKQVIDKLEHATDFSEGVAAFAVNVNHEGVRKRWEQINKQGF